MIKALSVILSVFLLLILWLTPLNPLPRHHKKEKLATKKTREIFLAPYAHTGDDTGFFIADNIQHLILYWNRSRDVVTKLGVRIEPLEIKPVAGTRRPSAPRAHGLALQMNLGSVSALSYDTHTRRLFFSESDKNRVRFVDKTGLLFTIIDSQCASPSSLTIGHETLFVACKNDHQIKEWNFIQQFPLIRARLEGVEHVLFSRQKLFATQPHRGVIYQIENSQPKAIARLKSRDTRIYGITETRNQLILSLTNNKLLSYDLDTFKVKELGPLGPASISSHPKYPNQIAFSDSENGRFGFYDLDLKSVQRTLGAGSLPIKKAAY